MTRHRNRTYLGTYKCYITYFLKTNLLLEYVIIIIIYCVYMYVCHSYATMWVWRSKDHWQKWAVFYHVDSWDETQVIRFVQHASSPAKLFCRSSILASSKPHQLFKVIFQRSLGSLHIPEGQMDWRTLLLRAHTAPVESQRSVLSTFQIKGI